MNIFVYSDESGVFDRVHNDLFVFGGLLFFSREQRDDCARMYLKAERDIRNSCRIPEDVEVKASTIDNKDKYKLYRSLNSFYKFGVVIHQKDLLERIFETKKDKQRYLDYAYKIGVKRHFQFLIKHKFIDPGTVERLYFFVDEHSTATNGKYELEEALEQEFKSGTFNYTSQYYYPPIFPCIKDVQVEYCNSVSKTLIRAADIVANRIAYLAKTKADYRICSPNMYVSKLP